MAGESFGGYLEKQPAIVPVTSDPDGVLTAQKGTLAIDTTTGITWRNINGGTDWWPEVIPPRFGSRLFTDFISVQNASFWTGFITTGTASSATLTGSAAHPGLYGQSVTAVSDAHAMRSSSDVGMALGAGKYYLEACSAPQTAVEDGTNRYSIRIGFGDQNASDYTDGVYFEASLAGNGNANWWCCTASGATGLRTKIDSGVAPALNVFNRLRFRVNAAGTRVDYWIDDVAVGNNTSNIPTGAGRELGPHLQIVKTLGSTIRWVQHDYFDCAFVLSNARGL